MKSKMILCTFSLMVVLGMACGVQAQDGLALMKVDPAARPSGMAGAFVSIIGDPNSAAYNPAGVISISSFVASFGHNTYWSNTSIQTGYVAAPLGGKVYVHGGVRFAEVNDLESRFAPTLEPDALFGARDVSFKSGLAYRFSDKLSGGFGIGWFYEKIDAWRGSAFNIDAGLIYVVSSSISLGASATNMGSDFTLKLPGDSESGSISLPTTYRFGGSYRYEQYLGALDVVVLDDETHLHVGAEAEIRHDFSIRSGYMLNYDSKNFTAGASFSRRNITFDYAFVPYSNDLGTSHLFNLTVVL